MSNAIKNRYDFVVYFDVENGNPNGDPDAGNMPRIDPETGLGLVTDVCLKRKIRNYVEAVKEDSPGFRIYIKKGVPLNRSDNEAFEKIGISKEVTKDKEKLKKAIKEAKKNREGDDVDTIIRDYMCSEFYDIRTFGAVMTTMVKGALNCGQVRGPVQFSFARSVDPIVQQEVSITRVAITTEDDAENKSNEMGNKFIVPYGLYRCEGYVSANLARKTTGLCIVPMTVDVQRFSKVGVSSKKPYGRYIAYCGNMLEYDGISILIRAFSLIASEYTDINLVLAGHSVDVPAQKRLVEELKIKDRVFFLGKIKGEEVPGLLYGADLLVLASPKSIRASATMPCKVGEYLCTSRPVVVTGQGEILNYLTDGVDSFLAKPDSVEDFALKMIQAISDPVSSCLVGRKGRDVALREFSGEKQAEKIIRFYSSLIKNNCD